MQSAAMGEEDGAGDVEAESEGMRAGLKGAEEVVRVGDAGAGIEEVDGDQVALHGCRDADFAVRARFEGLHAVAREVDEDL